MNAAPVETDTLPLLEVVDLKWLFAGEGVSVHVERLQRDAAYAQELLARAAASSNSALRATAARLARRLAGQPA